jgi:hypothetical protein
MPPRSAKNIVEAPMSRRGGKVFLSGRSAGSRTLTVGISNDISSVGVQPIHAAGTWINFRLDSHPTNHFHRSHRKGSQCLARDNQRLLRRLTRLAASRHGLRTV